MNNLLKIGTRVIVCQLKLKHCNIRQLISAPDRLLMSIQYYSSQSKQPPTLTKNGTLGSGLVDLVTYESVCNETLESLCEYFDNLIDNANHLKNTDITYSVSNPETQ